MIYFITGANGSGKTLNALKWVRELQVKDGRTVYFHGFEMDPLKQAEFGWLKVDPLRWQDCSDGGILVFDECQDQFPPRANGSKVPDYVNALAVHRKRGFDFFMITQHPRQIDSFVKSLIGSPGWHRHIKRPFGADMASVIEWSAVNAQPEKDNSGKNGKVSMTPHPKEVYTWYKSAVLHTGKKHIPRQVYFLALAAVLVPGMFYGAFKYMSNRGEAAQAAAVVSAAPGGAPSNRVVDPKADLISSYAEALPGFPHTAPRYADVVKPVVAPYPAACIQSAHSCACYTQQGTRLPTVQDVCAQIVRDGFFIDWEQRGIEPQRTTSVAAETVALSPPGADHSNAFTAASIERPKALTLEESRVSIPSGAQDGDVLSFMRGHSIAGKSL